MDFEICSQQIYGLHFSFLRIRKKEPTGNIGTTDSNYCVRTSVGFRASYKIIEAETEYYTRLEHRASKTHKNSSPSAQNDYLLFTIMCTYRLLTYQFCNSKHFLS